MVQLAIIFIAIVAVLLACGAAWQAAMTRTAGSRCPPPGRLVDIGGYRLHIQEYASSASVPVVFEQGLGSSSLLSGVVPREVAVFGRSVTYDRAGLGWSDESPRPRVASEMVSELRALLRSADVNAPYVLVGHSFGGFLVRLYAYTHPEEVAGLVLLDVAHEGVTVSLTWRRRLRSINANLRTIALAPVAELAASFGLVRLALALGLIPAHLRAFLAATPDDIRRALRSQYSRPLSWKTFRRESSAMQETKQQVREARLVKTFPDIPVRVVTAGRPNVAKPRLASQDVVASWRKWTEEFHGDLARESARGKHLYAEDSGHEIPFEDPQLVVDVIREVVEEVHRLGMIAEDSGGS